MSNKGQLLQDPFLNTLRKEHVPVSIYLVNGIKLQGQIESFDQYVVLLRNTVTQMVYKHVLVEGFDLDRKSTRLNSSHSQISYAVFCLKKKERNYTIPSWPVRPYSAY